MERHHFANELEGTTECTLEEQQLLLEVKAFFGIETYGDLHDIYLATDVLALADIIQNARRKHYDDCGLDLMHSVTLPSASYQKMLKTTGVKIETLHDGIPGAHDLLKALNRNIRGGVSVIFQPMLEANDPKCLKANPEWECEPHPEWEDMYEEFCETGELGRSHEKYKGILKWLEQRHYHDLWQVARPNLRFFLASFTTLPT